MNWWYGLKAFERILEAKLRGDVRPLEELPAIAAKCADCPNLTGWKAEDLPLPIRAAMATLGISGTIGFCGEPVEDGRGDPDPDARTCGCPVLVETTAALAQVTVKGIPMTAAGKPEVGSEACPRLPPLW